MRQIPTRSLTDDELVRLYKHTKGQSYFTAIYARYHPQVYHQCLRFTNDPDLAQDHTQNIFIRVFLRLEGFQQTCLLSTWLFVLTRNYCISQQRMKRPTNWVPLETVASIAQEPNPPTEEQFYWLQVARMQLSPEEADLLTLRYDQDLPLEQISQELSLSVSAVKMRLKRCRDKLRGQLKTYAID